VIPLPPKKQQVRKVQFTWAPQLRQLICLEACGLDPILVNKPPRAPMARVIGYGGSAGAGKTDLLLGVGMLSGLHWPGISIGYFRREYPMLEGPGGAIMRSHELMSSWAQWNGGERRWWLPTGSILQFCHAADERDVFKYQSLQFDIILMDEATQFTRFQYRYLMTRNRATRDGITPFMVLATNPGGIGHIWFKTEMVDIGTPEEPHEVEVEPGVLERHIFIPAKLSDNKILERRDPSYRRTLEAQPETVRKQLLEGNWDAMAGLYFASWRRDLHVIPAPKDLKAWLQATKNHKKFRCLDYGLDMTACYWVDVANNGGLTVYRELYKPDLILSKAARLIVESTTDLEQIAYTVASPDLWNRRQDGGVPGEETMRRAGLKGLKPADDRRVPGWEHMAEWLEPYVEPYWHEAMKDSGFIRFQDASLGLGWRSKDGDIQFFDERDGKKASNLVFLDSCPNAIRVIPGLIRDDGNSNDVSDKVEDHAGEAIRYGLMSRPKPYRHAPDPLAALAEIHKPWSAGYRVLAAELQREDPKNEVELEDLGM
jgi:phage terminase large subunit